MTEPTIKCPKCSTDIKLTESLAAPLLEATRQEAQAKIAAKDVDFAKREEAIRLEKKALEEAQRSIDDQVAEKLKAERTTIAAQEAKKAKEAQALELEAKATELAEMQTVLADRNTKLAEAQKAQAEVLRKERELDDAKRELDLTVEQRIKDGLETARQKAKTEAEEALGMRVAEKEKTIADMQKQIEELKRKAEQGSQQLQGEVLELALESTLRGTFPIDLIEPVAKGEFGGDVVQRVVNPFGQQCGAILWESKRTKNWSDGWLVKLRADQRSAKAELAVIVSQALPKGVDTFALVENVWVADPKYAIPLATCLRQSLMEVANTRLARDGQETKMELVYAYLTGPRFKQRVEAVIEKFTELQTDLNKERTFMMRQWSKREAQINAVIGSTVGMVGDLQGIAGSAIQRIEGLDIPELEDLTGE